MTTKPFILALALLTLTACDSGLAYKADLGQTGPGPSATATKVGQPTSAGQAYVLAPAAGDTLPSDLSKISIAGTFLPLSVNAGNPTTYSFLIPSALGFTAPADSAAHPYAFVESSGLPSEHAAVAQVTFQ